MSDLSPQLSNIVCFQTLFIVESRIEPTKGSEFCRASTLCHLHLSVQRVYASPDSSLMYEVLADQTMWAVCGKTAGDKHRVLDTSHSNYLFLLL